MSDCDCDDWNENIDKVNSGNTFVALRSGNIGYTGKIFVFCPWCGTTLTITKREEAPLKKLGTHTHQKHSICEFIFDTVSDNFDTETEDILNVNNYYKGENDDFDCTD